MLSSKNINISEYKISKIMKENGLTAKYGRKKCKNVHTSEQVSEKYISENLYAKLDDIDKSKEIWSMDFTEQKVSGKRMYTCGIVSVNIILKLHAIHYCKQLKNSVFHIWL